MTELFKISIIIYRLSESDFLFIIVVIIVIYILINNSFNIFLYRCILEILMFGFFIVELIELFF